jgi:hypothetical protein
MKKLIKMMKEYNEWLEKQDDFNKAVNSKKGKEMSKAYMAEAKKLGLSDSEVVNIALDITMGMY